MPHPSKICAFCLKELQAGTKSDACKKCIKELEDEQVGGKLKGLQKEKLCAFCLKELKKGTKADACLKCIRELEDEQRRGPPPRRPSKGLRDSVNTAISDILNGMPIRPSIERLTG